MPSDLISVFGNGRYGCLRLGFARPATNSGRVGVSSGWGSLYVCICTLKVKCNISFIQIYSYNQGTCRILEYSCTYCTYIHIHYIHTVVVPLEARDGVGLLSLISTWRRDNRICPYKYIHIYIHLFVISNNRHTLHTHTYLFILS